MMSVLRSTVSGVRRELFRLGTIPYNAVVLVAAVAVMIESAGWKIRGRR